MRIPIVSRFQPDVSRKQGDRVHFVAGMIRNEHPHLDWRTDHYRHLMITRSIDDRPALQLDDFSEIPVIGNQDTSAILQQRARLRAFDGDCVAQSRIVAPGFPDYCEYQLGIGRVQWLYPVIEPNLTRKIAFECWQDRRIRNDLVHSIRKRGLRYIHPHVSTVHVWELASLLESTSRKPLGVIGPTPSLARFANDKIEFSRVVDRLLGPELVPHTEVSYNFATLAKNVMRLAATHKRLGIKFPYGTGGAGNFVIEAEQIRSRSLQGVHEYLIGRLSDHQWPASGRVLIDVWEDDVIASPSAQIWIPPLNCGDPVMEGLFNQRVTGEQGEFVGCFPAHLPPHVESQIINYSFLLARLFQELGYVGRCSFDLILIGNHLDNCRIEFIECNARWGGTSIPMTLMNRLGIADHGKTFVFRQLPLPPSDAFTFAWLRRKLSDLIYDPVTGKGHLVLINPARIRDMSALDVIGIGDTNDQINTLFEDTLPARLKTLASCGGPTESSSVRNLHPEKS